jgi:maltose alpha-D-glucosyltransferase/alpha-amylase
MPDDPHWYKDAVIYQLHVRAFHDSDGDGTGDFRGLAQRLDYLQDLGVTALWLQPFYPSPRRDDGYDISDYRGVHPAYGTLRDFRAFLQEAHRLGMRVVTELVINHTSDQHPWFQASRRAPRGSVRRDYYVWTDDPGRYGDTRIIFKDSETSNWAWDPLAREYYWHRFYSHQPDLNFDNPAVQREVFKVLSFWLKMGVDGLRLDAVPYLYEREGTSCENLPETHTFLRTLRRFVDERFANRMLLAEANQWPEDAVAYFGGGDQCHMAFHFPLMPRMYVALSTENRFPIVDILEQTPSIPENCQWALFLRNHDELTLEMVTDEERDYMYRAYARDPRTRINMGIRRRLAPLLGNDRRRIELLNALLFSMPGTPIIYYGDEIGMGDNVFLGDRNGVRTPLQWSADRNAGFSRANPQRLDMPVIIDPEYHYEAVNIDVQHQNPQSLLWWMKRLIALRQRHQAFGRGTLEFLHPDNRHVLAYLRSYQDERILVVANLSRFAQFVQLDLRPLTGMVPLELFGRTSLPPIGDQPYFLTLGPHGFFWFLLQSPHPVEIQPDRTGSEPATIAWPREAENLFAERSLRTIESALAAYLPRCRWFGGKLRTITHTTVLDAFALHPQRTTNPQRTPLDASWMVVLQVEYTTGTSETYLVPLVLVGGERAAQSADQTGVIARLTRPEDPESLPAAVLVDGMTDDAFTTALLETVMRGRRMKGRAGRLVASFNRRGRSAIAPTEPPRGVPLATEQSNTSLIYGDQYVLKLYRRLEEGRSCELEMSTFLTQRAAFPHTPPLVGALEYETAGEPQTLAILHAYVRNEGNAWDYTLDHLNAYLEHALSRPDEGLVPVAPSDVLLAAVESELPDNVHGLIGRYLESAELLGQRTAEMHTALTSAVDDPSMAPTPFTSMDRRSLYQSMRSLAMNVFQVLRSVRPTLETAMVCAADDVLGLEGSILRRFRALLDTSPGGVSIRTHGDYHLGQVLHTGKDFVIIDFEGEPVRPLSQRRLKRSPLRDVAGMIRSFDYAGETVLRAALAHGLISAERLIPARGWVHAWREWVTVSFLSGYLTAAREGRFLPSTHQEIRLLLDVHLLEKAIYEVNYEINHRPDWLSIPLHGILRMFRAEGESP